MCQTFKIINKESQKMAFRHFYPQFANEYSKNASKYIIECTALNVKQKAKLAIPNNKEDEQEVSDSNHSDDDHSKIAENNLSMKVDEIRERILSCYDDRQSIHDDEIGDDLLIQGSQINKTHAARQKV